MKPIKIGSREFNQLSELEPLKLRKDKSTWNVYDGETLVGTRKDFAKAAIALLKREPGHIQNKLSTFKNIKSVIEIPNEKRSIITKIFRFNPVKAMERTEKEMSKRQEKIIDLLQACVLRLAKSWFKKNNFTAETFGDDQLEAFNRYFQPDDLRDLLQELKIPKNSLDQLTYQQLLECYHGALQGAVLGLKTKKTSAEIVQRLEGYIDQILPSKNLSLDEENQNLVDRKKVNVMLPPPPFA